MNILFVHQNFPGQFKHLAPALRQQGHTVLALGMREFKADEWFGVKLIRYHTERQSTAGIHPWVTDFEAKTIRGEACFRAAQLLKQQGFTPDVIVAHPGWGESLFLKEVWPNAKLGVYCEFYYHVHGTDFNFDPEFPSIDDADACRLRLKNINNFLHFDIADAGLSPTHWQAGTFPQPFRNKITVAHDGIDTSAIKPNPDASLTINTQNGSRIKLTRESEVVTFVNRNLEPYRGYHQFMRALPELLKRRPKARIMIVGGDEVSYGAKPPGKQTWKSIFAEEVKPQIPPEAWTRIHFLGRIAYPDFIQLLQLSTVHVYLTYPFVLSWSLLEAMSAGCAIVASNTQPVLEAIEDNITGCLVNFFDHQALAEAICQLLDDAPAKQALSNNARIFAVERYDLKTVCLPEQIQWVETLATS